MTPEEGWSVTLKKVLKTIGKVLLIIVVTFIVSCLLTRLYYVINEPIETTNLETNKVYSANWGYPVHANGQYQWYLELREDGTYSLMFDSSHAPFGGEDDEYIDFSSGTYKRNDNSIVLNVQEYICADDDDFQGFKYYPDNIVKGTNIKDSKIFIYSDIDMQIYQQQDRRWHLVQSEDVELVNGSWKKNNEDINTYELFETPWMKDMPNDVAEFMKVYDVELEYE